VDARGEKDIRIDDHDRALPSAGATSMPARFSRQDASVALATSCHEFRLFRETIWPFRALLIQGASRMRLRAAAFVVSLLVVPACIATQAVGRDGRMPAPPTPAAVRDILEVRPFTLQTPYRNDWSKERASVTTGVLVVLDVDPAYVVRRDSLEPVLYAGNVTVQRLNHGDQSGRVIGIVPGTVDLSNVPIWFGTPELPERVTENVVRSERALAEKTGVRSFPAEKIAARTRPVVAATDLSALLRDVAAELIYQYSPQEREIADSWRLPVATPKRPY
jgi:hypothetical protein